jgi:hypothetical protein
VVSVEPNGTVDVTYYESREQDAQDGTLCTVRVSRNPLIYRTGNAHSFVNTFWVQSHDGGVTFSAVRRVSSATSDWCTTVSDVTPNFGDYIGHHAAHLLIVGVHRTRPDSVCPHRTLRRRRLLT